MPTTHAFRLTSPKAGSFIQSAADEWGAIEWTATEWTAADSAEYNALQNELARQPLDSISEQLWAALNRKRQLCKTRAALPSAASTAAPTVIEGAELPALLADLPPAKDEFLPQEVNRGERK